MIHHLVVPGLLGPPPGAGEGGLPRYPLLERMLARGDREDAPVGLARTLFDFFGCDVPADKDAPSAALCYQMEAGVQSSATGYLMHADPLHLRPDQDRLLAYDLRRQPLDAEQAEQISATFNRHFAQDGLRLLTPHPQRWYLSVDHTPDLRTVPLAQVLARNLDLFLPQGADAARWTGWLNETQMLFYQLPLNQQREQQGQLTVNGLWLSGGGVPAQGPTVGVDRIEGESLLAQALNRISAEPRRKAVLWVSDAAERALCEDDPVAWRKALDEVERRLAGLQSESVCLMTCDGRAWHWRPGMRRRFWRRIRPVVSWLGRESISSQL